MELKTMEFEALATMINDRRIETLEKELEDQKAENASLQERKSTLLFVVTSFIKMNARAISRTWGRRRKTDREGLSRKAGVRRWAEATEC